MTPVSTCFATKSLAVNSEAAAHKEDQGQIVNKLISNVDVENLVDEETNRESVCQQLQMEKNSLQIYIHDNNTESNYCFCFNTHTVVNP
jgi:hypothetical protein